MSTCFIKPSKCLHDFTLMRYYPRKIMSILVLSYEALFELKEAGFKLDAAKLFPS